MALEGPSEGELGLWYPFVLRDSVVLCGGSFPGVSPASEAIVTMTTVAVTATAVIIY